MLAPPFTIVCPKPREVGGVVCGFLIFSFQSLLSLPARDRLHFYSTPEQPSAECMLAVSKRFIANFSVVRQARSLLSASQCELMTNAA